MTKEEFEAKVDAGLREIMEAHPRVSEIVAGRVIMREVNPETPADTAITYGVFAEVTNEQHRTHSVSAYGPDLLDLLVRMKNGVLT